MKKDVFSTRVRSIKKRTGWDRLKKREKKVLLFGVVFVAGFFLLQAVVLPYGTARRGIADSLRKKNAELVDIQLLRQEYIKLKSKQGAIAQRLVERVSGFSLFSFLEERAASVKVKDRVTYMKPSSNEIKGGFNESVVEMKIEKISVKQLVDFLLQIESDKNIVVIERLSIQENSQQTGLLDIVVRIKTFELNRA